MAANAESRKAERAARNESRRTYNISSKPDSPMTWNCRHCLLVSWLIAVLAHLPIPWAHAHARIAHAELASHLAGQHDGTLTASTEWHWHVATLGPSESNNGDEPESGDGHHGGQQINLVDGEADSCSYSPARSAMFQSGSAMYSAGTAINRAALLKRKATSRSFNTTFLPAACLGDVIPVRLC